MKSFTHTAIRRLLLLIAFGAMGLAAPRAFAGVNRWTTGGPFGVHISSLAIDPTNSNMVYAGTREEIFLSRDGGLSWASSLVAGAGKGSPSLAIDSQSPSNLYAATSRGVFKSADAGSNWVGPLSLGNFEILSVAIDPVTPSTVYAGTAGGLYKSGDRGASWSGRLLAASIYNLALSAQGPSTIFAADFDTSTYYYPSASLLYRSTEDGATWSNTNTGIRIWPGALAVDPTNSSVLYAGGDPRCECPGGFYKSVNSGSTWHFLSNLGSVSAVVVDPRNPNTLYASDFLQVLRSTDGGLTWRVLGDPGVNIYPYSLAIDRTGTRLYAGSSGFGVFAYQIVSGAVDLAVGIDNKSRLLIVDIDNRAILQDFDNSGGSTSGGVLGPLTGWGASAVDVGPDGLTRVMRNHIDGSPALELLSPAGNQVSFHPFSPVGNWTAVDVSVAPDNTTQFLWTNPDGRMGLWTLDSSGTVARAAAFGPFPGWVARSISHGADGLTRVLWGNTDGRVGLSLIDGDQIVATYRYTPGPGWTARDLAMASDQQARILLVHSDGEMTLWSVNNSGAVTNHGPVYEAPVSGQSATRIAAGADGLTRVLWRSPEGTGSLSLMDLDNVLQNSFSISGNWDY